jgi:hypothetical protein
MPQARKSTRSSSARRSAFKEPAALKKLNQSLDSAQKALTDLRRHAGSDAASGTKTLYKGLGKFVTDARKDTTKFSSALRKDFEQAAKAAQSAAKKATGSSRRSSTSTKSSGSSRSTGSSTRRKSSSSSRSGGSSRSRSTGSSTRRSTRRSS